MGLQKCLYGGATEDTEMSATIYGQIFFRTTEDCGLEHFSRRGFAGTSKILNFHEKFHQRILFKSDWRGSFEVEWHSFY